MILENWSEESRGEKKRLIESLKEGENELRKQDMT